MTTLTRGVVELTVPASTEYLRHIRVLAATVADDAGFDVAAIESLRVAVDELCALALGDAVDGAVLTLALTTESDAIVLRGTCGPVEETPEIDPIAAALLAAGASSHELSCEAGTVRFELRADRRFVGASDDDQ